MEISKLFEEIESKNNISSFISSSFISSSGTTGLITFPNGNSLSSEGWNVRQVEKKKFFGIKIWDKITEITPEVFFNKIKKSKKEIKIIDSIIEKYLEQIKQAEILGQTALVEKLKSEIEIVKNETLAVLCGVKEYLSQSQIEKLLKKSSRNIEITKVSNFIRPIPKKLVSIKERLDKEKVFSEYVILHYDPKKENTELTKKEKERKKDPILFGLIKGSRNFYFIGDWIDEYCNLTLKEAINIIEEKSNKILK